MQARRGDARDSGFGLVEVVISMLILGLIAIAIIPALWQGLQYSSEQSTVATATRQLNGLIEEARRSPTCWFSGVRHGCQIVRRRRGPTIHHGRHRRRMLPLCGRDGIAVPLTVTATQNGRQLADVSARIFVRGAQVSPCTPVTEPIGD